MALLSSLMTEIAIPVCAFLGIAYFLVWRLLKWRGGDCPEAKCAEMKRAVSEGVKSFLRTEYQYVGVFVVAVAILTFLFLGSIESFSTQSRPCTIDPSNTCKPAVATAFFKAVSLLLGAFTLLGTKFAIYPNARTDLEERTGVGRTCIAAFGLLVLYLEIILFKLYYGNDWEGLFEAITGYGLGGSFVALLGRTCGGIYAKAADVCVHLVKKIKRNIQQNDRNPAVIPNNVGDVVGDIAGMGTDLFGSYAESSCTALVVASVSSFGIDHNFTAMCYPLLISYMGIFVCLITTLFMANFFRTEEVEKIKPKLERQLLISSCLMSVGIAIVSWIALPSTFTIYDFGSQKVVKKPELCLCVFVGLWARQISGFFFECCPSTSYRPVQDGAGSFGRANVIIPILAIAISIFLSFTFAATYGIAVAAIGMLSTISHNAGGIAKKAGMSDEIIERTDALDAAGNTTGTSEKGFAVGSAAMVSLALLGAFLSRADISPVDVLTPMFFTGLIMGAILSFKFSAMTMKIVGSAGLKMVRQVFQQNISRIESGHEDPDFATCIKISTDAAFRGMILPGALVMLIPLIVGTFFGVEMLSGVLAGSLVYVVWIIIGRGFEQIAIWVSCTGGAWHQAIENISAGALEYATTLAPPQGEMLCRAAKNRDAIGNPQKDTSGPPLNILIQLLAVESLVFAPFFVTHGGLLFKIF